MSACPSFRLDPPPSPARRLPSRVCTERARRRGAALLVVAGAAASALGALACEDQAEPTSYLGPAPSTAYVPPPVHVPGTATAAPAPTTELVVPPEAAFEACGETALLSFPPTGAASLAVSDSVTVLGGGSATTLGPLQGPCAGEPIRVFAVATIGTLRALDSRGTALVAGETAVSAVTAAGARVTCDVPRARSVALVPGTETGYAITGGATIFQLDWSTGACEIAEILLPDVSFTLAVAASNDGAWLATVEPVTEAGGALTAARARRLDREKGGFDELSPVLGGQPGTVCSIDALAVSDDGERVAVLDGTCGRLVIFRGSDGDLVSGVSLRARSLAPVPGEHAFLTVASTAGKATFTRITSD